MTRSLAPSSSREPIRQDNDVTRSPMTNPALLQSISTSILESYQTLQIRGLAFGGAQVNVLLERHEFQSGEKAEVDFIRECE